jgi:hypothetical protein
MYIGNDLGKYHQADLMRQAQAARLAGETASAKAAEGRATMRKVLSAAVSMLLWPIKH